ncbi:mechanosensitive ion channel [Candidatus Babeliales bacterium]|nr:mechanosensitive ion channel [Candidatus Babeliales bacterium]MBP9844283.1 mechanosensitive ion channel [Candidatus Babeliales bacterium]
MKKVTQIILLLFLIFPHITFGLNLQTVALDTIKDSVLPPTPAQIKFFTGNDIAQKLKMLETLKIEYKAYIDKLKQFIESLDKQMHSLKKEIDHVKSALVHQTSGSHEFLTKKLNILNKKYQALPDIREVRQQIAEDMKQHIEFLDKYFQSTDGVDHVEEKTLYTFSDLQKLTRQVTLEKDALARLSTKKENEESVVSRTELIIATKDKEIKTISETLDLLKKSAADVKNQLIVLDLEKETLQLERELAVLRLEEHVRGIEFIDSQMFVITQKINEIQDDLTTVRSRMKVDKQDLLQYQQENNEIKKETQARKVELMRKRTDLTSQKTLMQDELDKLAERYKISLSNIAKIEDWEIAADSISEEFSAYSVSSVQNKITVLEQKIDEARVGLLIQDAKVAHAQTLEDLVKSLYAITQAKMSDIDQLEKERAHFKDMKNSIQNMIKMYQDRTTELHTFMKSQYKKTANIKKCQERFRAYTPDDIVDNQRKYNEGLTLLLAALKLIEDQGDVSLKLSEQYAVLIEQKEETLVLANFMLQELDLISVWHRSNRAVTWDGVRQIIPNLITFAQNAYGVIVDYVINFHLFKDLYEFVTTSTSQLFAYILFSIFLYIIFLCFHAILPALFNGLMMISPDMQGLFLLSRVFAVMCGFLQKWLGLIFCWMLIFACLSFYQFSIAFTLIFYGASIVFLTYISRAFLFYMLNFNRSINFVLLGESFEDRFAWIFSFFSASTIFILFFRKMFMLVMMYQQSEFPIILLRLYHVVIFISVVFSIEKEELLNLIPKSNVYFQSISQLINDYYYLLSLFCIMVLILSDPYLGGYGHLIWFMILNVTMSVLLFATMYLLHNAVKAISLWVFFKEYGESGLKERFEYAKTWYAIFVVALFFISSAITILFALEIWGYPLAFEQIERFLNHSLMSWPTGVGSKIEHLRVIGILRLISSLFFGFLLAFLFRRYVLQRVFDIQYVDPGVQDTIMTISRYVIIIGTVFVGFTREGLGSYVLTLLALGIIAFGWTFKDLFADFVAYFFILVHRRIKVGDYIRIDSELMGIVKKISPQAVILRRKNAVTIVVPNSIILKSPLYNWNYTRGYIAFDDIIFSVPFHTDPFEVKKILFQTILTNPDVLKVPEPIIRLDDFSDKGYTFMVRGYISSSNTMNQWGIASDVRLLIVAALRAHGIEVAEPVMRVKIKQEDDL